MAPHTHPCPAALLSSLLIPIFICMNPMHTAAATPTQLPLRSPLPRQDLAHPHLPDVVVAGTHALHALSEQPGRRRRALQSRARPPRQLAACSRCTLCTCSGLRCTGRCRKNGQVHNCRSNRGTTTAGVADEVVALLPFAAAPHIGCASRDRLSCAFAPTQIAPDAVPGFSVDVRNGTVSARCHPEPADPWDFTYGACLCDFTSADGRERLSVFCEPSALFAPLVPRLQEFAEMVAAEAQLEVEVAWEEEVEWDGVKASVSLVVPLEEVDYVAEGEVEVEGPAAA